MHAGFDGPPDLTWLAAEFLPYAGINRIRFNGSTRSDRASQAVMPPRGSALL